MYRPLSQKTSVTVPWLLTRRTVLRVRAFLRCSSHLIILNLAQIKFSISFLNRLINFSLTFWGLLPKLWISFGILITVTGILSVISGKDPLGSPCPLAKTSKCTIFTPRIFVCLCVYFASLIEKDCLLFLQAQTKPEKMSSKRFLRTSCLPEWSTCLQ